ncbi:Piso0_000495 [Millerozyma farinosa CBS 7064]|uniref:Piso0_000495 protein n=1 Tax=Pichia sorbitophila (strain ATCC MYA-4447 / BCRC 22081 / CBS 7064 / NBRC 10061 / NRRL Y-12695) TaxID=559304 RepID=G8YU53_PICSO|nr:Piso0_000495 [Millerozyma farinosa CBS 7064]CCE73454.1 Piso0_000495 [Millerozyma farinosa CBS 7064]
MSSSTLVRLAQFTFGIILLVISSVTIKSDSGLGKEVEDINKSFNVTGVESELINEGLGTNLSVSSLKDPSIVGLSSSALTVFSHAGLRAFNNIGVNSDALDPLLHTKTLGVPKKQVGYLGGLVGSESSSIVLWFISFIYQAAKTGSFDCESVDDLVNNYKLNPEISNRQLQNFFKAGGSGSSGSSGSFSTNSTSNLDSLWKESELLIKLSGNCKNKKAGIAIAALGWITYLATSLFVTRSGYSFLKNLRNVNRPPKEDEGSDTNKSTKYSLKYQDPFLFPQILSESGDEEKKDDGDKTLHPENSPAAPEQPTEEV